jgi:hypothetical protein
VALLDFLKTAFATLLVTSIPAAWRRSSSA